MNDNFNFSVPMDIFKSDEPESDQSEWRIGGYASTSANDRQGDEIVQDGIDYSEFVNHGFFNLDHRNDVILGYPDKNKCKIDEHGFYVEGVLLKGVEQAKNMWQTAVALKKSGAPRKLCFSVEGKVLKRDALGRIVKAKIYNVALTATPVNPTCTWEALCKSFAPETVDVKETTTKSIDAGYGDNPVIPEDLDKDEKDLSYKDKIIKDMKKKFNNSDGDINKSELQLYYQITRDLSSEDAENLVAVLTKNMEV